MSEAERRVLGSREEGAAGKTNRGERGGSQATVRWLGMHGWSGAAGEVAGRASKTYGGRLGADHDITSTHPSHSTVKISGFCVLM